MNTDKEELKKLGERIRNIRLEKKMTQAHLANNINKDQQSIQRLEAGRVNPSYLYLLEVSKGLNLDLTELIRLV